MYTCTVQFLGGAETLLSSLTNYEINEENITKFKQVLTAGYCSILWVLGGYWVVLRGYQGYWGYCQILWGTGGY